MLKRMLGLNEGRVDFLVDVHAKATKNLIEFRVQIIELAQDLVLATLQIVEQLAGFRFTSMARWSR